MRAVLATLAASALGAGCSPPLTVEKAEGQRSVLLIVLDGVRTDECTSTKESDLTGGASVDNAPELWSELAPDATVVRSIQNPVLTSTVPGHAAMLTGRPEALFTAGMDERGPELYRPLVPTIFEEVRSQLSLSSDDAVLLTNTVALPALTGSLYPGFADLEAQWSMVVGENGKPNPNDSALFDSLRGVIQGGAPRLLVVNAHDADRAGHAGEDYAGRARGQARLVGDLWNWLGEDFPDYRSNLLMVVTADHGRHRHDEDGGWYNHGDACGGCREVPLFVAGGGAPAGELEDDDIALYDVAPSIAAFLGVDLPFARGRPFGFLDVGAVARSGAVDVAAASGHIATQAWLENESSRSSVLVDDVQLSTAGVLAAEAPAVAVFGWQTVACFREYDGVEDDAGFLPWRPRCLESVGDATALQDWSDIGFPEQEVGPFWKPALAERGGVLWAAWLHTPHIRNVDGDGDELRVARFDGEWTTVLRTAVNFTTSDVSMVATNLGFVVAIGTSDDDPEVPYNRHVAVYPLDSEGLLRDNITRFYLNDVLGDPHRAEHPALSADGDTVRLAMLALGEALRLPVIAESSDAGGSWSQALPVLGGPDVDPHLAPVWSGDSLAWIAIDDGEAWLCRGTEHAACEPLSTRAVDGLAADAASGRIYWNDQDDTMAWGLADRE